MMKRTNLLRKIIYILAIMNSLAIPIVAWLKGADLTIILLYGAGALGFISMVWLMDKLHQSYTDSLLLELSKLVESMIDVREDYVFSDVEDTLLSKLQNQIIKLSSILKAHNKAIRTEKNEMKSFISDIAHQIKTPVASIKMFGDLLQESDVSDHQRSEYLQMLGKSLDKLVFLTDSLIKMSQLESGIINLKQEVANLQEPILQAVKQVYQKANKKNIDISFVEESNITLQIDRNWTGEAIFNMLDNAVKYTPSSGKIIITVRTYEFFARIDISDNGKAISEAEQGKIFQRFYRGQGSDDVEGVGIGLYLSRKIITNQGGYIKVKSDQGGNTFSVFLPLK